jgi:hypothetical protein
MEQFQCLETAILQELKEVDIKEITKYIISLPAKYRSGQNPRQHLFKYLKTTVWSFFSYTLLECIVHKLKLRLQKDNMERYVANITQFLRQTTVSQFASYWPGRTDTPRMYNEMTITLNASPEHYTVEQLISLKDELCRKFLPRHSEFAVLFGSCSCTSTSIEVKWFIAIDLVVPLMTEFYRPENAPFFASKLIESLQIRRLMVYPDPNQGI